MSYFYDNLHHTMRLQQPTLNNFSVFKSLDLFGKNVCISQSGIIHAPRIICLDCGTVCSYNGSSNKGKHAFSQSCDALFLKGQQYCPNCNKTIQVENEWIDNLKGNFNDFLASQVISLKQI